MPEIYKRYEDGKPFGRVLRITINGTDEDGEKVKSEENLKLRRLWEQQKSIDSLTFDHRRK